MIETREIADFESLRQLTGEWSALWDTCPGATPFQSPEWNLPWWEAFHPGRLAAVAVHDGGRLTGLAPFYIGDDRVLRLIGTGITDHLDILATGRAASAVLEHLARTSGAWERCDLLELPEDGALAGAAAGAAPVAGLAIEAGVSSVCPVVPLPASPGRDLRRNLRRYGDQLAALGETRFEEDDGAHHAEFLDALYRLHAARWRWEHGEGVLADARVRAFHRQVAAGFAARGWLRMFGLRHAGALVAAIYAFAARGRAHLYLSGFDPELRAYGPGTLLLDFAFRRLAHEGIAEADLLRGREPYKYRWGALDRPSRSVTLRTGVVSPVHTGAAGSPGGACG